MPPVGSGNDPEEAVANYIDKVRSYKFEVHEVVPLEGEEDTYQVVYEDIDRGNRIETRFEISEDDGEWKARDV